MGEWKTQVEKLQSLLGLTLKPVGVTFTNKAVEGEETREAWMCAALKEASLGEHFLIDSKHSKCGGGTWHLGLAEPPRGAAKRAIQHFLTAGEKLTSTIVTFHRMNALTAQPPTNLSDYIYICPAAESKERPDLIVFMCNPEQACRLLALDAYHDGIPHRIEVSGSLCHSVIAYPAVTGRTNLSTGDWTARRMQGFSSDIVFLTIPCERMHNLVDAVPKCSAGTAGFTRPHLME